MRGASFPQTHGRGSPSRGQQAAVRALYALRQEETDRRTGPVLCRRGAASRSRRPSTGLRQKREGNALRSGWQEADTVPCTRKRQPLRGGASRPSPRHKARNHGLFRVTGCDTPRHRAPRFGACRVTSALLPLSYNDCYIILIICCRIAAERFAAPLCGEAKQRGGCSLYSLPWASGE